MKLTGDPDVDAALVMTELGITWRELEETPARVLDALRVIRHEAARRG